MFHKLQNTLLMVNISTLLFLWYKVFMNEFVTPADAARDLAAIIPAIQWTLAAAHRSTVEQHDPGSGHDNRLRGHYFQNQICDRFDRVCATGKFLLPSGETLSRDCSDIYYSLTEHEISTMPQLEPGSVLRRDLNGAPCWHFGDYHLLFQSFGRASFYDFKWATQSGKTKFAIAQKPFAPTTGQLFLDIVPGYPVLPSAGTPEGQYLIIGYRTNGLTLEAGYGIPRDNTLDGHPWHWFTELNTNGQPSTSGANTTTTASQLKLNKKVTLKAPQNSTNVTHGR